MNISNQAIQYEDEIKPLWRYILKLRKISGGENNMTKCNRCNFLCTRSYTRVRTH